MNIPNLLSAFRLLLVPVFVIAYFSGDAKGAAVAVYVLAAVTDVADGRVARKYNMVTGLGRILDPLADKSMNAAALVCLVADRTLPVWAAAAFISVQAVMILGSALLYRRFRDVISSDAAGKSATVVFFAVCVILMIFRNIPPLAAALMISTGLLLMAAAFINYLTQFIKAIKRNEIAQ